MATSQFVEKTGQADLNIPKAHNASLFMSSNEKIFAWKQNG